MVAHQEQQNRQNSASVIRHIKLSDNNWQAIPQVNTIKQNKTGEKDYFHLLRNRNQKTFLCNLISFRSATLHVI